MKPLNISYKNKLERELALEKILKTGVKETHLLKGLSRGRLFLNDKYKFVNEHKDSPARHTDWNSMDCKEFLDYDLTAVS